MSWQSFSTREKVGVQSLTWIGSLVVVVILGLLAIIVVLDGKTTSLQRELDKYTEYTAGIDTTQMRTNHLISIWTNVFRGLFPELPAGRMSLLWCATDGEGFLFFALKLPPFTGRNCDTLTNVDRSGPADFLTGCEIIAFAELLDSGSPLGRSAVCCERLVDGKWQDAMSLVPATLKR